MAKASSHWLDLSINQMTASSCSLLWFSILGLTLLVSAVSKSSRAGEQHQRMKIKWVFDSDTSCFWSSVRGLRVGMSFPPLCRYLLSVSLLTAAWEALTQKEDGERLNGRYQHGQAEDVCLFSKKDHNQVITAVNFPTKKQNIRRYQSNCWIIVVFNTSKLCEL